MYFCSALLLEGSYTLEMLDDRNKAVSLGVEAKGEFSPNSSKEEQVPVEFTIKGYMDLFSTNHDGLRLLDWALQSRGTENKCV